MSVDPELIADLRNCNRPQTAALLVDMYEALELADAMLAGCNMNVRTVEKKVKGALARAEGQ